MGTRLWVVPAMTLVEIVTMSRLKERVFLVTTMYTDTTTTRKKQFTPKRRENPPTVQLTKLTNQLLTKLTNQLVVIKVTSQLTEKVTNHLMIKMKKKLTKKR